MEALARDFMTFLKKKKDYLTTHYNRIEEILNNIWATLES
jgi:hypothetical protein